MRQSRLVGKQSSAVDERLLMTIAEDLKLPFLQAARTAELVAAGQRPASALDEIQVAADMAIRLLDSYLFGARLAGEAEYQLELEPVSVSGVLYDSGQQLDKLAKMYGVELELSLGGTFEPVLTNRQGLTSALTSLGYSLVEALPNLGGRRPRLQLAAHRCRYGIVAGLYSEAEQLTHEALRRGRKLRGQARQPLVTLTHSGAAGVFVADALLQAMDSELQTSRHHKLFGLGTVLQPNPQLRLV